jgi:hypothetical protein
MNKSKAYYLVFALLLVSILIASCGNSVVAELPATEEKSVTTAPLEEGTWESFEFTSQALADNLIGDPATRTIHIYLPPGYDASDQRYPVVYTLHSYSSDLSDILGMGEQLNILIANGESREMILILPDGDNMFGGSYYLSSPTIGDYESYISKELVAHVDSNYRTIPNRDTRGITGCGTGGNGALHLAFKFPNIFSSAAAVSGYFAYEKHPLWEQAKANYREELHPDSLDRIVALPWDMEAIFALAAAAAPNPDNIPFHFDLPFEIVDGEARIVPEVLQKVAEASVIQDIHKYLDQPVRLRGVAIYHGVDDDFVPLDMASSFSDTLSDLNVEHEYVEVDDGHCDVLWDYTDVLKFMSANLAGD